MSWAEVLGAERIYIGAVQQDSSGYPDCRPEYYEAFNEVIRRGTKEGKIRIETPLIALRKFEIVRLGLELDAPFDLTWSCYQREDQACGSCDSCALRLRAFAAAGAPDPDSLSVAGNGPGFFMNLYFNIDSADRHVGQAVLPTVSRAGGKMKKPISLVTLLALLLGMSAIPLWGQQTGAVKGNVKDQNGKPMDGATVELLDPTTGRKYDLKTNAKGEYSSIGIALGTYDVSLLKDGKTLDKVTKVPVIPGEEASCELQSFRAASGGHDRRAEEESRGSAEAQ